MKSRRQLVTYCDSSEATWRRCRLMDSCGLCSSPQDPLLQALNHDTPQDWARCSLLATGRGAKDESAATGQRTHSSYAFANATAGCCFRSFDVSRIQGQSR